MGIVKYIILSISWTRHCNKLLRNFSFIKEADSRTKSNKQQRNGKKDFTVSFTSSPPATYSWENIEIYLETSQGNCFKRSTPIQKRILDNGIQPFLPVPCPTKDTITMSFFFF
jgi:hypothetical protein